MKKYFLIILLILYACNVQDHESNFKLTQAIPVNSDLIIKIYDVNKINTNIKSFPWWDQLKQIESLNQTFKNLETLNEKYNLNKLFHNQTIYVSSVLIGQKKNNFLFVTSISETNEEINNLLNTRKSSDNQPRIYEGVKINKTQLKTENGNSTNVFFAVHNGTFILSFSQIIIEESIRQINHGTNIFTADPINKLYKNLPKYSDINILVKTQFTESIIGQKNIFLNSDTWSWFDVELEENSILLHGVTNRGLVTYLKNNKYSDTKKSDIENILPRHIKGFYKYQINDNIDLNEVINIINPGLDQNIYHLSNETCVPNEIDIAYDDNLFTDISYLIFEAENEKECVNYLQLNNETSLKNTRYLNYNIRELKHEKLKENLWLKKMLEKWNTTYYIIVDNYIVLSYSIQKIKSLINNRISNQTIGKSKALSVINEQVGNKSHTAFYLTFENHQEEWKNIFNSVVSKNIGSPDYFFTSLFFLSDKPDVKNPTTWSFNLDHETNYQPQIVTNHYTKKMEILTQDIENNIYLLNENGEKLWKKNIGNSIIGKIHQIDAYKNNKLQYLFNTKDSIYLIDRNGKHVSPFPIKSKKLMSVPLAVFDYDNSRNYRILVPMENEMKMYNQKGEIVSGWEFIEAESKIINTPEHYQLFDKDYIVISTINQKTYLLNRKGQERVKIKEKIDRSQQKMNLVKGTTLYDSKLITTNAKGDVIYINFNGNVDTLAIQNLNKGDKYIRNNNYTIILKDKRLTFSSKNHQFEYNFKTKPASIPQVFFQNKSPFIAIQNKTDQLIYILNGNGELITQPFFGTTDFNIATFGNKTCLIVGSSEGVIYNYNIN
ncbi:MAG: hypothetical protein CMD23_04210 [Flavobacteriales bacterium]|nr:hypothetical protein [Flavobacteriales bacterium]